MKELVDVGNKFVAQCSRIIAASADYTHDAYLQQRFRAASAYLHKLVAALLSLLEENPVTTDNKVVKNDYLKRKNRLTIELSEAPKAAKKKTSKEKKAEVPQDVLHPALFEALRAWRALKAAELGLPAYTILQQKALLGIANLLPDTLDFLLTIPYLGKKSVEKYGEELLALVHDYRQQNPD